MRRFISNPVLTCDNARELETVERILAEKYYDYAVFGESLQIEVYISLTPRKLEQLIKEIERENN